MSKQIIKTISEEQKPLDYLPQMLADIKKETSDELFLNKSLLIQLLTLIINQPDQFKPLIGGYSNDTYHYEKEYLILRFPKPNNPLYRHTSIEIHNLEQARLSGLTSLKVVAYSTKHFVLVTLFIPFCQSFSEKSFKEEPKNIIELALVVKQLHYGSYDFKKNPETAISFIDASSKTYQTIKSVLNAEDYQILKKLDAIRNCLAKFKILKCPSHGDLHHFNLISIKGSMQLMDWEVSSIEDPAYDISRFFCVADFNTDQKNIFLQTYQNSCNILLLEPALTNLKTRIQLYEPLNYFSIVVWAKYAILFAYNDKRNLLDATIKNFTEKTLNAIEKINLAAINPKSNEENNVNYPNSYLFLFKPASENELTKEQEKKLFKYR